MIYLLEPEQIESLKPCTVCGQKPTKINRVCFTEFKVFCPKDCQHKKLFYDGITTIKKAMDRWNEVMTK
jgi:hypothetical protein